MTQARIGRDHVVWGYRLFLDRDPENEQVIQEKLNARATTADLRLDFLASAEFRAKNPDFAYANERNIVIKEFADRLRLFIDLADEAIGLNIIRGRYERSEMAFVQQHVHPGQSVLDVGANIGFFTILMAALVGPAGTVYAFEPVIQHADLLARSVTENGFADRVILERSAVGHVAGAADLIVTQYTINPGGAYLSREGEAIPINHETIPVPLIALDHYPLRRPVSFIKIDVEGAEPLALRGAKTVLQEDKPIILSELHPAQLRKVSDCSPQQLVAELRTYGYECYLLEDGKAVGKITASDYAHLRSVLFLPV